MKGFILKDLYLIRGYIKNLLVMLLAFSFVAFNNVDYLTFFLPFICMMICISTFNYDEFNKWDAYAITLPNGRKNVIRGKYATTLIIVVISVIISVALTAIIAVAGNKFNFGEMTENILGIIFGITLLISVMYPFVYKFGIEKGRIFLIAFGLLVGSITAGIVFFTKRMGLDITLLLDALENYGNYIFPIVIIVMLYTSYRISYHIYLKKEF